MNIGITIDKRLNNLVKGFLFGENNDVIAILLKDIDETFFFGDKKEAQAFLNRQAKERFAEKELRTGYFDYEDEHKEVHRYFIKNLLRGKITEFEEVMI